MGIGYYEGEFKDISEIRLGLSDRSIFFGDAIYDAAIGRNGKIYLEKEHINRFFLNALRLGIKPEITESGLSELLHKAVKFSGLSEYFIYFQLSRYEDGRKHAYTDSASSRLLLTVNKEDLSRRADDVCVITGEDIRYSMCNIKTVNLLPAVMASSEAEHRGCNEAIFIRNGIVTECAHSNVFIIKNGIVYTHPEGMYILPGITRARTIELMRKAGIHCRECEFGKKELFEADEVFITSTSKLVRRVSEIDGKFRISTDGNELLLIKSLIWEDFLRLTEKDC